MESYTVLQQVLLSLYSNHPSISDESMACILRACANLEKDLKEKEDMTAIQSFEQLFYSLPPRITVRGGPSRAMQLYAHKCELNNKKKTEWASLYGKMILAKETYKSLAEQEKIARKHLETI